jgi:acetylornithine deacetylase/succinyl-diaminopimelate desuccinylase-like protein
MTMESKPGPFASAARAAASALATREDLRGLWAAVRQSEKSLADLAVEICEVPAPTGSEGKRAQLVGGWLARQTGKNVDADALGNRWVILRGAKSGKARIMVVAHLDTVFPEGTNCKVKREKGRLFGPGIGDNCSGLSIMLNAARLLRETGFPFRGELILAASVGEEGLGNLRGVRGLCERFGGALTAVLALDGGLGQVVGGAVGSARYRIATRGPGGHSWSDFGRASALHHLARIASSLAGMEVPNAPRTTFNIGVIKGGTSINTIASEAELLLDLRSLDAGALNALEAKAERIARSIPLPAELALDIEKIGERPSGGSKLTLGWVDIARAVWSSLGVPVRVTASSTDANIPLAQGVPASTLGTCRGGRVHTEAEWLEPESLPLGLEGFLLCVLTALELFSG